MLLLFLKIKGEPDFANEISIKNNNKIILPKIIKSEVNLLVFPFFALERKDKRLKTEYREITKREDPKKEKIWNVSANPEYGYPGPFDREVHKSIEQIISEILKEEREIKNPIPFSIYNLCKRIGIKGGGNYQQIKKALERIQATVIKSEKAFYHKGKKEWISSIFSLYDGVIFRGEQLEDGSITEINLLYLSDIYLQSLNSFNTKSIDYTYWKSLKSKIASRLYEILGVKFYGVRDKEGCPINYKYSTLCQLLPLTPYRYFSDAKRQLNFGNDELKEPKREVKKFSKEQVILVNKLLEVNVSKVTAEKLIKNNDQELIKKWIEAINYSNASDKAAYLVKAIRENWQFPEEYNRGKKRKK